MFTLTKQKITLPWKYRLKTNFKNFGLKAIVTSALFAFICTRAIVPVGYMATSISSGGPFNLCPSDPRSALLSKTLTDAHTVTFKSHNHQHHDHGLFEKNSEDAENNFSNETGSCLLSNLSIASLEYNYFKFTEPSNLPNPSKIETEPYLDELWSRPPIRSPPKFS